MDSSRLPTEVELVYEVMPCNALRTTYEPGHIPHACSYFHKWGTYHSYDYAWDGPPPTPGIVHKIVYRGRAPVVPELLSGCRKAPLLALGINPNLPGWWPAKRNSLNPLFDDYKQYAHYFRYRAVAKLEIPQASYSAFGGGPDDSPFSTFELRVPQDAQGFRMIPTQLQPQKMYETYQWFLDALARQMGWTGHHLSVGEDLAYGNMVACPSAKWVIANNNPDVPGMTLQERQGIIQECFFTRNYFARQLFQALPKVILIFSQATASAFISEFQDFFIAGSPQPGDPLGELIKRKIKIGYGVLNDGTSLEARIIFAPHITGNPKHFSVIRDSVVYQLTEEATAGRLSYNSRTKHLRRTRGGCVFCSMLQLGPCGYFDELCSLTNLPQLSAESPVPLLMAEKQVQTALSSALPRPRAATAHVWDTANDDRLAP